MARLTPDTRKLQKELCEALGIDTGDVIRVVLTLDADDGPDVIVTSVAEPTAGQYASLEKVVKAYRLLAEEVHNG